MSEFTKLEQALSDTDTWYKEFVLRETPVEEEYLTKYDGKAIRPGYVACRSGQLVRFAGHPREPDIYYHKGARWDAGAISAYLWNQMSRDERLDLLLLHWRRCACEGFLHNWRGNDLAIEPRHDGVHRTVVFRTDDLPARQQYFVRYPLQQAKQKIAQHLASLSDSTNSYDTGENPMDPNNFLVNNENKPFYLFTIAAYNPTDGEWLFEPKTVTAQSVESARNKAIELVAQNLPEGKALAEVLDEYTISVKPS